MPFTVLRRAAATLAAGALLVGTACSETTEPQNTTVQVQDDSFNPMTATVSTGGTVTWNWTGSNQHNVTWVAQSGSNSPTQTSGSFAREFLDAGNFDYYCTIHGTPTAGMRGSVVVQ